MPEYMFNKIYRPFLVTRLRLVAFIFYTVCSHLSNPPLMSALRVKRGAARKGCKITFYGQADFNGQKIEYSHDAESVGIQEHSIQTSDKCCWRIYR